MYSSPSHFHHVYFTPSTTLEAAIFIFSRFAQSRAGYVDCAQNNEAIERKTTWNDREIAQYTNQTHKP